MSTGNPSAVDAVIGAGVLSYSLSRTLWPLDFSDRSRNLLFPIAAEAAAMLVAVDLSGYWNSPFVFSLVVVISAAGFAGGIPLALNAAAVCLVAVALPYHLGPDRATTDITLRWGGELILVAILAGYVRHLALRARAQTSKFVGQLRQLSEVNDLLLQLRHATQTMPMSLDLGEALDSSANRLRELLEPEVVVILMRDHDGWRVAKASGVRLAGRMSTADLPPVLRRAAEGTETVALASSLGTGALPGLAAGSRSGLYVRLSARNEVIGLVAVERDGPEPYGARHAEILQTLSQQMAIALDNARWFARIGILAAEQERNRIARDLHDRLGQSLALVGFELDRLARNAPDPEARGQVLELRENVRAVVSELREALHDLRTDVSEERAIPDALGEFLERVRRRTGLEFDLKHGAGVRLPLTVEREVWRIAQEAILNVERHARATSVGVAWEVFGPTATLSVTDDGEGMPPGGGRTDGYGILGMHERAQAIGATLTITSFPGRGTSVRLAVPTGRPAPRQ